MFDKYHKTILERLYTSGNINRAHTPIANATKGFPKSEIGEAKKRLRDLVKWDYIKIKKTSHGDDVYLNIERKRDIEIIIESNLPYISNYKKENDMPPLETRTLINFNKNPFHTTIAKRNIQGKKPNEYRYYDNSKSEIKALVIPEGKPYEINLGAFNDPNSRLSKAIIQLDKKYGNIY